jgi:triacylglycerol lipase
MGMRPIPEINWDNIRPPYDWWDFFKDADRHPFRFKASSFDMLNAWWLIETSALVYSSQAFVQATFARIGLPEVQYFDRGSTQCFVACNNDFIIVAFRGTETRERSERPDILDVVQDILTDSHILLVPHEGGGLVHQGFKRALDEVWCDGKQAGRRIIGLKSCLDEMMDQRPRPIWFTGHSLGAALATLAADRYGISQGLYTFGSPRVGDFEFKNKFKPTHFRFVNGNDIVARVPPEVLSYRHVGILQCIYEDVSIQGTSSSKSMEIMPADTINDILELAKKLEPDTQLNVPSWLLQHVPLLYSTHIWNRYILNE